MRESIGIPTRDCSILLIDDDVELCELLGKYLEGHSFQVSFAHDGPSGLSRALSGAHDAVILDVMLPLLDGFEILHQLRRRTMIPVIMLTARVEERDRVTGLEGGADDYLLKPFATRELLARIRAVTRRTRHSELAKAVVIDAGPVRVNTLTGEAWVGSRALNLTATEFAILELLLRPAGRIVSRDEISAILYHRQSTPYERSVDVHVSHLRKKLEPELTDYIGTARGVGYKFVVSH